MTKIEVTDLNHTMVMVVFAELLIACFFWAWGFVATKMLVSRWDPLWLILFRFGLSFVILLPFTLSQWKTYMTASFWPGFFLALTLITQTLGLKYTGATKFAFIGSMYVFMVPLINFAIKNRFAFSQRYLIGLGLSTLGIVALNMIIGDQVSWDWSLGETLALLSCLCASAQIIAVEYQSRRFPDTLKLNSWSFFWVLIAVLVTIGLTGSIKQDISKVTLTINQEPLPPPLLLKDFLIMVSLILFSTILAFWLQIRNQRKIHSNLASIIFLLESPITLILSSFLLWERFSLLQSLGMSLVFFGSLVGIAGSNGNSPKKDQTKWP